MFYTEPRKNEGGAAIGAIPNRALLRRPRPYVSEVRV